MQLFRYFITTLVSTLLASDMPVTMDSLDSAFTIEINGKAIGKIDNSRESRTQADVAAGNDAAVFTLKEGRLESAGWQLGRGLTEDKSFMPKQVLWFKTEVDSEPFSPDTSDNVRPVAAEKQGDSYTLLFHGSRLMEKDGSVFADLMNGEMRAIEQFVTKRHVLTYCSRFKRQGHVEVACPVSHLISYLHVKAGWIRYMWCG
ncbi:hypothetical protein GQ44DRAFT_309939 [Phaeosphaeriaceae sp. PMI808]|nr:hypothetical protein GQ44DRAFT_309939 [Phaeosphaeriaceae sp. PMI808]